MKKTSFGKRAVLSLALVLVAGLALPPEALARPGGGGGMHGGGGGGRGGGMHAGGGGGGARQVNNANRDVRANNVRNTSVNNVNMNRNVNANVNRNINNNTVVVNNRGGWDYDHYHPVATAAAVTAGVAVTAAVVGSIVNSVPANCVPVNYGGLIYQQCGSTWYQPQGSGYVVINQPY